MNRKTTRALAVFSTALLFSLAGASPVLAQPTDIKNKALSDTLRLKTGVSFTSLFVSNIINILFIAAVVTAVVYFLINAILMVTSGGNKEQFTKGRSGAIAAITGLAVLFLLYMILNLINYFFELNLLKIDLTPLLLR